MSTSSDRTTRLKFLITERDEPIPCCTSDRSYTAPNSTAELLATEQSYPSYISSYMLTSDLLTSTVDAADATILEGDITTSESKIAVAIQVSINPVEAPVSLFIEYSTDGNQTYTIVSNIFSTNTFSDITEIQLDRSGTYHFRVRISTQTPISIISGKLLLTA